MGGRKKSLDKKKPDVSKELEGLEIRINSLGEIQSTLDINKINEFLDTHVEDKKLHNLDDLEGEVEQTKQEEK